VINGNTQLIKKVIDEYIKSGRFDAARRQIEATRESGVSE
jgi:glutamate mutase epsilon subunit